MPLPGRGSWLSIVAMLCSSILADALITSSVHRPAWHHPCGGPMMSRPKNLAKWRYWSVEHDNEIVEGLVEGKKNPSVRPLRRIRTQIRITHEHFRKLHKDIATVYSAVMKSLKKEVHYEWLPEKQLDWYKDNIRCLDKRTKVEKMMPALHTGLQNFSATFEAVLAAKEYSNIFTGRTYQLRCVIIQQISQELKRLLCEVETAMMYLGLAVIPAHNGPDKLYWDLKPDHTRTLILDWGVIITYQHFLEDWSRIIRRVVGKKGNIPCKPKIKKKKKTKTTRRKPSR
ncbi:uncharacterized protein LOC142325297 [Lycorma delicatula]|uniref:uncharacterized protein LOC142325297 n=1 Tax=Lycorma delicatula TaxID=130591 RepID=UPI003F51AA89